MHKMIYGVIGFRPISVVVLPFIVLYLALHRLRRGGLAMPIAKVRVASEANSARRAGHSEMTPRLNEIVGLPRSASPAEMDRASDEFFQKLLGRASRGDVAAQRELVALRVAYLNWAYASPWGESAAGSLKLPSAIASIPGGSPAPVEPLRWS